MTDRQPTELSELKETVREFMKRLTNIENEITLLNEDKKNLVEEFSNKLDVKTLKQAIRMVKIREKVDHKDAFDAFVDILEKDDLVD